MAERDIAECEVLAEAAGAQQGSGEAGRLAESTAVGVGIGAAGGAVAGAITGSPGLGTGVGAASGAVVGLLGGVLSGRSKTSTVYQGFVDRCLRERGYDPIGWQ